MSMRGRESVRRIFAAGHRNEEGATAVVVGISLFMLFGGALVTVDAGSLWTTRRDLITGTDGASLAAAGIFAEDALAACTAPNIGEAEAASALSYNRADATLLDFSVEGVDCVNGGGRVTVEAEAPAALAFAPMFGYDEVKPFSSSTAHFGPLQVVEGLLPMTICLYDEHVVEWRASSGGTSATYLALRGTDDPITSYVDHPSYAGAGVVHHVPFTRAQNPACGDVEGSWGWIDFNGNVPPNGASALKDWLEGGGYPGTVSLGAGYGDDCNDDAGSATDDDCVDETGANASTDKAIQEHVVCAPPTPTADCPKFTIAVYDNAYKDGGQRYYNHVAFLGVVFRAAHKVNAKDGYFEYEFVRFQEAGIVGPNSNAGLAGPFGVALCGADHDDVDDRCAY